MVISWRCALNSSLSASDTFNWMCCNNSIFKNVLCSVLGIAGLSSSLWGKVQRDSDSDYETLRQHFGSEKVPEASNTLKCISIFCPPSIHFIVHFAWTLECLFRQPDSSWTSFELNEIQTERDARPLLKRKINKIPSCIWNRKPTFLFLLGIISAC